MPARGAQFHHKGVTFATAVTRIPAPRDPTGRPRIPSHKCVTRPVNGYVGANVHIIAAQVAAPVQIGVYDQLACGVVGAGDLECVRISIDQPIFPGHLDLLAADDLIDVGRIVHDLAPVAAQADVQGAGGVDFQTIDATVADGNLREVGTGVYVELVLEAVALTPGVQVDTVVKTLVRHDLIRWDVVPPLGLVAHEEIEPALRLGQPHREDSVCPVKRGREAKALHLGRLVVGSAVGRIGRGGGGFVAGHFAEQFEDRPAVGVSDIRALPPMDESNRLVGPLPLVLDKNRRRSVEQFDPLLRRHAIQQQTLLECL